MNKNFETSKILAVIPAYNEEKRIIDTINAIKYLPGIAKVVVVDDNSSDNTVKNAEKIASEVVKHKKNWGKGQSLNKFFEAYGWESFDGVLLADGDLGKSAKEFEHLIKAFQLKTSELIIAGFGKPSKKGGFGLVKGVARWAIKRYGGQETNTPLSGQRILTAGLLKDVLPFASGFGLEVDMTTKALRKGYKMKEVQVDMTHAETGRDISGFIHRGRQFKDVLMVVVKQFFKNDKRSD